MAKFDGEQAGSFDFTAVRVQKMRPATLFRAPPP